MIVGVWSSGEELYHQTFYHLDVHAHLLSCNTHTETQNMFNSQYEHRVSATVLLHSLEKAVNVRKKWQNVTKEVNTNTKQPVKVKAK